MRLTIRSNAWQKRTHRINLPAPPPTLASRPTSFALSPDEENHVSLVPSLSAARTRTGRAGHDGPRWAGEHHDPVVAYDDGTRGAAPRLREQQPELLV